MARKIQRIGYAQADSKVGSVIVKTFEQVEAENAKLKQQLIGYESCNRARKAAEDEVDRLKAEVKRVTEWAKERRDELDEAIEGVVSVAIESSYGVLMSAEKYERMKADLADAEETIRVHRLELGIDVEEATND